MVELLRHPHLRPPPQHAHSPDGGDGGERLQGERAHLAPTGEPGRVPSVCVCVCGGPVMGTQFSTWNPWI